MDELDFFREAQDDWTRERQGLQMQIADQIQTIGMLKNELRAQAGVIERMRNRTL